MDLSKLSLGDKIVAGAGLLLVISLLFFPWHKVEIFGYSESIGATSSPNGFWGLLGLLLAIVVVAAVLAEKLGNMKLPELPIPMGAAKFYACLAILGVLVLKLVLETEFLGFGSYLSIILAGAMSYGGFVSRSDSASAGSAPPSAF